MQCKATTAGGKLCKMPALKDSKYCFTHSAHTRQAQATARKIGGQNRHTDHIGDPEIIPADIRTIADAGLILRYTLDELIIMDNSIPRARALIALATAYIDAIKTGEIETQLKELLAVLQAREVTK